MVPTAIAQGMPQPPAMARLPPGPYTMMPNGMIATRGPPAAPPFGYPSTMPMDHQQRQPPPPMGAQQPPQPPAPARMTLGGLPCPPQAMMGQHMMPMSMGGVQVPALSTFPPTHYPMGPGPGMMGMQPPGPHHHPGTLPSPGRFNMGVVAPTDPSVAGPRFPTGDEEDDGMEDVSPSLSHPSIACHGPPLLIPCLLSTLLCRMKGRRRRKNGLGTNESRRGKLCGPSCGWDAGVMLTCCLLVYVLAELTLSLSRLTP